MDNVQDKGVADKKMYPYYAYGLPESFVLDTKRSWTIFQSRPKENFDEDKKKMDLDFEFLAMRGQFISQMHKIEYDSKSPYFASNLPKLAENATEEQIQEHEKLKSLVLKPLSKNKNYIQMDKASIDRFFSTNDFRGVYSDFNKIIKKVLQGEKDYYVELKGNTANMTKSFSNDVMPLVKKIFSGFNISEADVNDFFYRLAIVSPNVMQVHILNRLYFYFHFAYSYLDVEKIGDNKYDELKKVITDLEAEEKAGTLDASKSRKLYNTYSKVLARRTELIFNQFSCILASVLGTKGAIIEDDQRNFLEKIGNPATKKEAKLDTFKDQILRA